MTREEIISMAREAGFPTDYNDKRLLHNDELERFAQLVAEHEREACAQVCDRIFELSNNLAASQCAWEIRGRTA